MLFRSPSDSASSISSTEAGIVSLDSRQNMFTFVLSLPHLLESLATSIATLPPPITTTSPLMSYFSFALTSFKRSTAEEHPFAVSFGIPGITVLSVPVDEIDNDTMNLISVAALGNSLAITQGTLALAVGSPLGTNYSILTGNITSSAYSISTIDANYDIFTTDIVGSKNGSGAS